MSASYAAAVEYVRQGLSVIPIAAGTKFPNERVLREMGFLNDEGKGTWKPFQERRATSDELRRWFANDNNGIAIVTGPISGIGVVDADGADGIATVDRLRLSSPCTVITGKGRHLYFAFPEGGLGNAVKLLPGLDVRGKGGYVLAPPTRHPDGHFYRWVTLGFNRRLLGTFPTLPGSRDGSGAIQSVPRFAAPVSDSIISGGRNNTLASLAGSMRRRGMETPEILAALKSVNERRCRPPLPDEEVETIAASMGRYAAQSNITPAPSPEDEAGQSVETFLANEQKVSWLAEPFFARSSLGFVAGLPETLKTWLLIDFAIAVAAGLPWLGRFPVSAGKVLFIDQERFKGETQRRFRAVMSGRGLDSSTLAGRLFIKSGSSIRINIESSYGAFRKELLEMRPDVVIVDSFATFHTKSDTSRQEIQEVLERIKTLKQESGATFLFIHHENKATFSETRENETVTFGTMAGSLAIPAAAETVLTVRRHGAGSSFVHHTKSSLAPAMSPFSARVVDVAADKSKIIVEAY